MHHYLLFIISRVISSKVQQRLSVPQLSKSLRRNHVITANSMRHLSTLSISASLGFILPIVSAAVVQIPHSKSYDMPLIWNSFGFTTQTSIGTPPQNITSIIDWTWNSHYLVTTFCKGSPVNTYDCLAPGQSLFNQTKSSTFKNLSDQYPSQTWNPNHFFFNLDLKVQYGSDVQRIGPSEATVRVQAGDAQFQQPFAQPFEGIFGLSPVFPEQNCKYPDQKNSRSRLTQRQRLLNPHFGKPGKPANSHHPTSPSTTATLAPPT